MLRLNDGLLARKTLMAAGKHSIQRTLSGYSAAVEVEEVMRASSTAMIASDSELHWSPRSMKSMWTEEGVMMWRMC